jgi:hypothetical protein
VANEAAEYSDVGTLGDNTEVASTTTRKNPLYRDPYSGDLRLQTKADGYPFDSPAHATGTDGQDMGAFEAEYGSLMRDFIELSLADTISTVTGGFWRNPDGVPRELVPIKLTEGDKPGGGTYSRAKAIKRQWTLNWKPDANDMPMDQLIALEEVYRDAGPVAVNFGDGWIDCVVIKSNAVKDDQIDGLYTTDEMPRPLESLVLREL